jgi:hypothetical protein
MAPWTTEIAAWPQIFQWLNERRPDNTTRDGDLMPAVHHLNRAEEMGPQKVSVAVPCRAGKAVNVFADRDRLRQTLVV